MSNNMKVLIIGSGLGGLCLAQSLRRADIAFEIFERDKTPFERPQGYRLHLDADAISTVQEVLTPELQTLFEETSHWTAPFTSIMDTHDLRIAKRFLTMDDLGTGVWPTSDEEKPVHANVDRALLRQILLTGLCEFIHFGKQFERYECIGEDKVTAYFADGSSVTGCLLVGADGINSRIRRQRAPTCFTMDAGVTAIYGRLPLPALRKFGPKEALKDIFLIGSDQRKVFLCLGSVIFLVPPDEAAKKLSTNHEIHAQESYAVCIVGGRHIYFRDNMHTATSADLQDVAADLVSEWSSNAAPLVRAGDPESFFVVRMRTSVPSTLDSPTNVTLLGDAIHSMTPSLGRGANLAMRHGALLGRHLKKVAEDKRNLAIELRQYEKSMTEYGFQVVRDAAAMGQQRMAQKPLEAEPSAHVR